MRTFTRAVSFKSHCLLPGFTLCNARGEPLPEQSIATSAQVLPTRFHVFCASVNWFEYKPANGHTWRPLVSLKS